MRNKILYIVIGILIIGFISIYAKLARKSPDKQNGKIDVVASFYPMYFFTKEIGGDKINVKNITPTGTEPHEFEPRTYDIAQIENSKLLVINGVGLEPWADKISKQLKTKVVVASEGLTTALDPHIWLDPVLAQEQVKKIEAALSEIDPTNKGYYEINSKTLQEKLDTLDKSFQTSLSNCKQRNIITSHTAFGYLATRYELRQIAISGISPDQEPSPKQMTNIIKLTKQGNIKYIFFETLVSPRLAETIAEEAHAETLVLNPLEGLTNEEQLAGEDYFSIQNKNLENLKIALECN